jgi:hypothetical protein
MNSILTTLTLYVTTESRLLARDSCACLD